MTQVKRVLPPLAATLVLVVSGLALVAGTTVNATGAWFTYEKTTTDNTIKAVQP